MISLFASQNNLKWTLSRHDIPLYPGRYHTLISPKNQAITRHIIYEMDHLVIDGVFNEDAYRRNVERIEDEIMLMKIELNETKIVLNDVESCLNYCKYFLLNCALLWVGAKLDLRQRFQNLIFLQGISYDGKAFGTARLTFIFRHLQRSSTKKSHLPPWTGLEPVVDEVGPIRRLW